MFYYNPLPLLRQESGGETVLADGTGLCYSGQQSGQQRCRIGSRAGPRPATTTLRGRRGACPGAGALTTPGSGTDAPDDPRSSPRSDTSRRPAPGPPANPPAAPATPPSGADLRRQRVIR